MTRRVLRPAIYTALLLFIALATVIAACAGTSFGSRWLIQQAIRFSGQPLTIERIEGTLIGGLTLNRLDYRSGALTFSAETLALQWHPPGLLAGELTFDGVKGQALDIDVPVSQARDTGNGFNGVDVPVLPLGFSIDDAQINDIHITRNGEIFRIDSLALAGAIDNTRVSIDQLNLQTPDYGFSLNGRLDTGPPWTLNAEGHWYAGDAEHPDAAGRIESNGTLTDFQFTHTLTQPLTIESDGRLQWRSDGPAVAADSRLPEQSLETIALPGWTLKAGRVHTEGWIDRYQWTAQTGVESTAYPPTSIRAQGHGNLSSVTFETFEIKTLDGRVTGNGELAWMPRLEWKADVNAEHLNPETVRAQWKGRIGFSARTNGFYDYGDRRFAVHTHRLDLRGRLAGHDLSAAGGIDISNDIIEAHRFNLRVGGNRFSFNGSLSNDPAHRVDLAWNIDADDLSTIPWPGDTPVAGRLTGEGRISGSLKDPRITARMNATGITYGNISTETIRLNASHAKTGGHTLHVTTGGLVLDSQKIPDSALTVTGTPSNHSIDLRMNAPSLNASIAIDGATLALQSGSPWAWRSTLQTLNMQTTYAGDWSLEQKSTISVSPVRVAIGQNCLKREKARLCARTRWSEGSGFDVDGGVHALPLTVLHPLIASNTRLEGHVDGGFTVAGAGDSLKARLELESPPGRLIVAGEDRETGQYPWRRLVATLDRRDRKLEAHVDFDLAELGRIRADAALAIDNNVSGKLQASVNDIGWLEPMLPRLRGLTGSLHGEATLSGTPDRPRINANASIQHGAADIPALGISITDFTATLNGENNRFHIESGARSGPGDIRTKGSLRLGPDMQYTLNTTMTGEAFEILNTPRATVQITPDVRFELTPSTAQVNGIVTLPSADINIKTMPTSAVSVSSDARIVTQSSAQETAARPRAVTADLTLKVGDDVHFSGFGLQTRLSGELNLTEAPGQPPLAYGELTVVEGRYKAYGQNLRIDGGRLIFQGPYDNPALDVRAFRETPDATVGLRISGTLKQPRSDIFSEPPLPDSEAMALLLTGRSLSSASESDANMLINAVASLGMERGHGITQQVARTFNLDQVAIQAGSGFEEGSLLLGKHLSPRLYVEYAVGFVDQAGRLNLEYKLTDNLKLEAHSGDERSMDLMYKIER